MIEYLVNNTSGGFRAGALALAQALLEGITEQAIKDDKPPEVTTFCVFAKDDPRRAVVRRYAENGYTDYLFLETLLDRPRYIAYTVNGAKVMEAEQGKEINSYLVFLFTPQAPSFQIFEIEWGLEDGGWVSEPIKLANENFDPGMNYAIGIHHRLYRALLP